MAQYDEKFKLKKDAIRRAYDLLPEVTHVYKGHRGYVLQRPNALSERELANKLVGEPKTGKLNADGRPRMSKEELDKQIMEFWNNGTKIPAVKLARIELCCGLREGLDYCNSVANANP